MAMSGRFHNVSVKHSVGWADISVNLDHIDKMESLDDGNWNLSMQQGNQYAIDTASHDKLIKLLAGNQPKKPEKAPATTTENVNSEATRPAAPLNISVSDIGEAITEERGKKYGPNPFNQETIGQIWRGLLESRFQQKLPGPIDPDLVALMMLALKCARAATPFLYNEDDYVDMHGYTVIAQRCALHAEKENKDGRK